MLSQKARALEGAVDDRTDVRTMSPPIFAARSPVLATRRTFVGANLRHTTWDDLYLPFTVASDEA